MPTRTDRKIQRRQALRAGRQPANELEKAATQRISNEQSRSQAFVSDFNAGHPGVTTAINQAGLPEAFDRLMRESRKINADEFTHQVIIGKSRDGMSFPKDTLRGGAPSSAFGLLAGLLRRI